MRGGKRSKGAQSVNFKGKYKPMGRDPEARDLLVEELRRRDVALRRGRGGAGAAAALLHQARAGVAKLRNLDTG